MTTSRHPPMALDAETLLSHREWLARFARALVANADEIDDVVQQTYATALAKPPRHAENLRGWLGTVARNVVRSRARSDSARVAREVALPPPAAIESPVEAVERAELRRLVVESVLALDEPYRSTVILRFLEEREVADIARLTASGEDTVRTRIRRGVLRVRELLDRKVEEGARGAADEGTAVRALLLVRLRAIAASAGPSAGAGPGGTTGLAAASRGTAHAGGRLARLVSTRTIFVGAAAVLLGTAGWWWRIEAGRDKGITNTEVASHGTEAGTPVDPATQSAAAIAKRSTETVAKTPPAPPPPSPSPRLANRGSLRGVVTGPDGVPVVGAHVWALMSTSHNPDYLMPEFGPMARLRAEADPTKTVASGWIATQSGAGGRFEFAKLPQMPGWAIGAFEPTVGAMVTDVYGFDHDHRDIVADVRLMPGSILRGSVRDENGVPVGGARVFVFTTCGKTPSRTGTIANPIGPQVGEYSFDFHCGDSIEIGCGTPTFISTAPAKVDITPHAKETVIPITLKRRPGIVVRGRIVDPTGDRVDFESLLKARFASDTPELRWLRAAVWARAPGSKLPPVLIAGMPPPEGFIEGRIDFAESRYEVVVPEGFHGSLELRVFKTLVVSVPLDDPHDPPDLECNEEHLPEEGVLSTFAVRYVDAETKEPIDLAQEDVLPPLIDAERSAPIVRTECDPEHGLIKYHCLPGAQRVEPRIQGYAVSRFFVVVPREPQPLPMNLEIPPANCGVHGFAFHADGRPFAKAEISVFRANPAGWIDATGPHTVTNADGEFEFAALAKGDHAVVVSGQPNEAPGVARFVASDSYPEVEVHSSLGRATLFRILGKPTDRVTPPNPQFQILDSTGLVLEDLHSHWASVSKSPEAVTLRLEDGHYTVIVERYGFRQARLEFDVPRESFDIPLALQESEAK